MEEEVFAMTDEYFRDLAETRPDMLTPDWIRRSTAELLLALSTVRRNRDIVALARNAEWMQRVIDNALQYKPQIDRASETES